MDTTISTNILFIILSIFLVIITLGAAFVAVYAVIFFKNINKFLNMINQETGKIIGDIDGVREKVKNGGVIFFAFVERILSFFKKGRKKNNSN